MADHAIDALEGKEGWRCNGGVPERRGEPKLAVGSLLIDDVGALVTELDRQHAILDGHNQAKLFLFYFSFS